MKAKGPKISIGIPVYNGEKFMRKCIESVLQQNNRNSKMLFSIQNTASNCSVEIM